MPTSHSPAERDPRRLLLIHPGALGDLIQALPAFSAVRHRYPNSQLALLVGSDFADVVRPLGLFDAVHTFDARTAYHGAASARVALFAGIIARLRRQRPDAVGVFKAAPLYAVLAAASGARRRVGLARTWGARLLTHPIAIDPATHREDRFLAVARALDASPDDAAPVRWPDTPVPSAFAEARRLAAPAERFIAVAPGGGRNVKQDSALRRWSPTGFADAVRALAASARITAVVLGAPGDRADADAMLAALAGEVATVDLVAQTSVASARAVIAHCDAYLGNDAGLLHLAGTTTTPIVAVFGPTDAHVTAPRGPHVRTVWRPARAEPCMDEITGALRPCAPVCCISRVDPQAVTDELTRVLAPARQTA